MVNEVTRSKKDPTNQINANTQRIETAKLQGIESRFTDRERDDIAKLDARRNKSKDTRKFDLKRSGTDTVILKRLEANEGKANNIDSTDLQNIKNKLGLSQSVSDDRVRQEVLRIAGKSQATRKASKLTKEEFARFGVNV